MTSPQPINAVQTRVVKTHDGVFCPQFSTDGMTWFPLIGESQTSFYLSEAMLACEEFEARAGCLADSGEVVWRSGK